MDSMVTPSAHGAGFATSGYSANFGPAYAAYGSSEAALAILGYDSAWRTQDVLEGHFVRDAIERRADIAELRSELKDLKTNGDKVTKSDIEVMLLKAEIERLKEKNSTPVPTNGNGG